MTEALIDQLVARLRESGGAAPLAVAVGGKTIHFPLPTVEFPEIGTKKTVATFPSGPPSIGDLLLDITHAVGAGLGVVGVHPEALPDLCAPLRDFANMAVDQLWVRFATDGVSPIAVGVELAYHGSPLQVRDAALALDGLSVEVSMPGDPALLGVDAWASGSLRIGGREALDVTIDSDGEVLLIIGDGRPVTLEAITGLFKSGLPDLALPELAPPASASPRVTSPTSASFSHPLIRYQLGSHDVSVVACFNDAALTLFGCQVSLDRLFLDLGDSSAADVQVHGTLGPVTFLGFLDTSGDVQITGHLPAVPARDLIHAVLPTCASTAWGHVALPSGDLTLSRSGGVDSLELTFLWSPAKALTPAEQRFLDRLGTERHDTPLATTLTLTSAPEQAQLDLAFPLPSATASTSPQKHADSPPRITAVRFQVAVQGSSVAMGLAADLTWVCRHQTVTLAGTVAAAETGAALAVELVSPSPWNDALGVSGLRVSGLSGTVGVAYDGAPTFGFTGEFSVPAPGEHAPFAGAVAVLFDGGDPSRNVFMFAFNHLDLGEAFQLFCSGSGGSAPLRLLREISFEQCLFCYSPQGLSLPAADKFVASLDSGFGAGLGDPFAEGFVARGTASLFGWVLQLDCEIDPATGIEFDVDVDSAVGVAGVFVLSRDAQHPHLGPTLHLSTHPSPPDPLLKAAGAVQIPGVFQTSAEVVFDETQFHLDATATFFQTERVTLSVHADFARLADASVAASVSLNDLADHSTRLGEMLSSSTGAAAKDLSDAQAALRAEQGRLDSLKQTLQLNERRLAQAIQQRDHTFMPVALEAEVVALQSLVTSERALYDSATATLSGLEQALETVRTPVALASLTFSLKAAQRAADTPLVVLHSVTCTGSASRLTQPRFTADIELEVLGARHSLQASVNFDDQHCVDNLLTWLVQQIPALLV